MLMSVTVFLMLMSVTVFLMLMSVTIFLMLMSVTVFLMLMSVENLNRILIEEYPVILKHQVLKFLQVLATVSKK
jgi:hypothetical protein